MLDACAPTSQLQLVDLSLPIDPEYWEPDPVRVRYIDHAQGADLLGRAEIVAARGSWLQSMRARVRYWLGDRIDHRAFPDGKGLSLMHYELTTHTGTHMDAPFHYGDKTRDGERARTICQVPLDWCLRDAVVLDVRSTLGAGPVSVAEVQCALERTHYELKPLDIVLLRTSDDSRLGTARYFTDFRGVTRDATAWLVERGIRVIGIDSFGFDQPFGKMIAAFRRTRDPRELWPAHLYGREREYCQLERLTGLGRLPRTHGFKIACFPVYLARADAAWCRVVALIDHQPLPFKSS